MSAHDVNVKPVLLSAALIATTVGLSIGAVLLLLAWWGEPFGGVRSGADTAVPALQAEGPALQSAPEVDGAAYRRAKARELSAAKAAAR